MQVDERLPEMIKPRVRDVFRLSGCGPAALDKRSVTNDSMHMLICAAAPTETRGLQIGARRFAKTCARELNPFDKRWQLLFLSGCAPPL